MKTIKITNNKSGSITVIRADMVATISVVPDQHNKSRTTIIEPTPETTACVTLSTVGGLNISCEIETLIDAKTRAEKLKSQLNWSKDEEIVV